MIPVEQVIRVTREQRRSRRKRAVRKRTVSMKRISKHDLEIGRLLNPPSEYSRPATRGECAAGERPCPFVSCKWHLYLDVSRRTGAIILNFPDLEPEELGESCCLDVAERGGETLERVGELVNMTRERVRQIENKAMSRIEPAMRVYQETADDLPLDERSDGSRELEAPDDGFFAETAMDVVLSNAEDL